MAIEQFVECEEKRDAFRLDSQLAWEAFHANGLHVTADEEDGWVADLEQNNDIEAPECRARSKRLQHCSMCRVLNAFGGWSRLWRNATRQRWASDREFTFY